MGAIFSKVMTKKNSKKEHASVEKYAWTKMRQGVRIQKVIEKD
jgi:hypothetical protein